MTRRTRRWRTTSGSRAMSATPKERHATKLPSTPHCDQAWTPSTVESSAALTVAATGRERREATGVFAPVTGRSLFTAESCRISRVTARLLRQAIGLIRICALQPSVRNPMHAPRGTRSPGGGSCARTTASGPVGSPSCVPVPTTCNPASLITAIACFSGRPTTSGTTIERSPPLTQGSEESGRDGAVLPSKNTVDAAITAAPKRSRPTAAFTNGLTAPMMTPLAGDVP